MYLKKKDIMFEDMEMRNKIVFLERDKKLNGWEWVRLWVCGRMVKINIKDGFKFFIK